MNGFTGLLEGLGILVAVFGGLIWADRRTRTEPRRERHPGLPPRQQADGGPPEIDRPEERESEIRDHLYGDATKAATESGVLSTRRVPGNSAAEDDRDG